MDRSLSRLGRVALPGAPGPRGPGRRRPFRRWARALAAAVALVALAWAGVAGPAQRGTGSLEVAGDPVGGAAAGTARGTGGGPIGEGRDGTGADHGPNAGDGSGQGEAPGQGAGSGQDGPGSADPSTGPALPVAGAPATPVLARYEDLVVHLPSAAAVVVGFHEAASVVGLGLDPVGVLAEDRNTTRTDLPADVEGGTPYLVLSSRGRAAGPTSAMDIVLRPGDPVLAPVTGTVADVRGYLLYGAHRDLRVEIVPDGRPDLRVVLIHLDEVTAAVGDRVVGGVTTLAGTARLLPFSSHIDRETEPERLPHVHLEVQPHDAPPAG